MSVMIAPVFWNQANYPETLHRFYIINTPWVFQGIYKIAEKFLDPVVKSKVRAHCPVGITVVQLRYFIYTHPAQTGWGGCI